MDSSSIASKASLLVLGTPDRCRRKREMLMAQCPFPLVIWGIPQLVSDTIPWFYPDTPIIQDPVFLNLTGINQPGCAVVMDPRTGREILFLPQKDATAEFWNGWRMGVGTAFDCAEASELTGFRDVRPIRALKSSLKSLVAESVATLWHADPKSKSTMNDHHFAGMRRLARWFNPSSIWNAMDLYWRANQLDDGEVAEWRIAHEITASAFRRVMENWGDVKSEGDILGILVGEMRSKSPYGLSFPPIVASGKNATVLHYTSHHAPLVPGAVLMDFGVRWGMANADVSRTVLWPNSTPLHTRVINLVRQVQSEITAKVKPGVTIDELDRFCWRRMGELVDQEIRQAGGYCHLAYEHRPHYVSHLIGVQVHDGDPFRNYRNMPLKPGHGISNEPGIYGEFELVIDGIRYRDTIGVRLEDNLIITPTGCEIISTCPFGDERGG